MHTRDTHPVGDALDLPSAERFKVHTDVSLHGCKQLLGGAVGGVGLLPPVALVPTGDNPLVFTAKHVQVIRLRGRGRRNGGLRQLERFELMCRLS